MNLSVKWLKDYVNIDNLTIKELTDGLTMSGSKVEGFENENDKIQKIVVGKILSIEKHPDADKLVVCSVDVGQNESLQIVTGATNVKENALVPVCLNGAILPNGTKIRSGKLRGVLSQGMMCSLSELGLSKNDFPYAIEDGIFLLEEDCEVGQDICEAIGLNDTKIEFEITSNRPDCLSVVGLARETAATFNLPFNISDPKVKGCNGNINDSLKVDIQSPLCSRYMAKMVKNVKIKPSPRWMRERLRASGIRPINNIVDITNFVMLEYGHPMHAFDASNISGNSIIIRTANNGETITTLDGVEHNLKDNMLMICDSEKPIAVAGVMGGEYSGVQEDTTSIIFEAACFDGANVRKTAKALNIRTDSSIRFEKGLNPMCCENTINRACELIELLEIGEVVGGTIDIQNFEHKPQTIHLDSEWINNFIGINLSNDDMIKILNSLDFEVKNNEIIIPPHRIDIEHKADVAEEIARIYGYDKIPVSTIKGKADGALTETQKFKQLIDNFLIALGCSEICTYSFMSPKEYNKIQLAPDCDLRNSIKIQNPLGEDTSTMRTTTFPSILSILSKNYNNRNEKAWLYEIGRVYIPSEENSQPHEIDKISIGTYGNCDFYTIKGIIETLLDQLNVNDVEFVASQGMPFHDYRCCEITKDGKVLGKFGEVHPTVIENYKIETKTYIAELDFNTIFNAKNELNTYRGIPKFPASVRDLSLVCDESIQSGQIEKEIKDNVGKILESIEIFDVYRGEQIANNQKSISYKLTMRDRTRTLTDKEIDKVIEKVLTSLEKIGVKIRFQS